MTRTRSLIWLWPILLLFSCSHQGTRYSSTEPRSRPLAPGCNPLSAGDRERILAEASPENFPATRYRRGPSSAKAIEKETDCSQFVHQIYKRAGLPYSFAPTAHLANAREFDLLPEKEARPGDLMLFRGHVGIVDEDGKIISALRTRHRKRKSSIAAIDRKHFRSFRGKRYVLRYRCVPKDAAENLQQAAARSRANRSVASESKKER